MPLRFVVPRHRVTRAQGVQDPQLIRMADHAAHPETAVTQLSDGAAAPQAQRRTARVAIQLRSRFLQLRFDIDAAQNSEQVLIGIRRD